jgi:hypothetical protein
MQVYSCYLVAEIPIGEYFSANYLLNKWFKICIFAIVEAVLLSVEYGRCCYKFRR